MANLQVGVAGNGTVTVGAGASVHSPASNVLTLGTNGDERLRLDSSGNLSFAGDTDTYIHHPSADQLAITKGGGSWPLIRFGSGGGGSTVAIGNTTSNLVTNSEVLSVRGYSSFKSNNQAYAAIFVANEGNTTDTANQLIMWNNGGANRGGIGYVPNTGELRFNNQYYFTFCTGSGTLGGTERLRIKADGEVGIGTDSPDGKCHIWSTTAGTVTADADADELTLESNANTGMSILSPGSGESSIYFGNPGTNGQKDGWIKYFHETHSTTARRRSIQFRAKQEEICYINDTGLVMANDKGISFINADDTASGETVNSSVLDDYEEGTFSPAVIGGSTTGSWSTDNHTGSYIKIGQLVYIAIQVSGVVGSAGGGHLTITGLPYTSATATGGHGQALALGPLYDWDVTDTAYQIGARVQDNSTEIKFWNNIDDAADAIMNWPFGSSGTKYGSITGCYRASA